MDSGHAEGGGSCRHEAAYYNGAKDYLPAVMPFIEEGLSAAEPVLALVPMPAAELLRERLNGQGRGLTFSDMGRLGRNPGRIISAMWDFIAQHPGRSVRVLGEAIWPARSAAEVSETVRHEVLINQAFAGTPVTLLCPYDIGQLAPRITAQAGRTHPVIRTALGLEPSPDYVAGRVPRAAARPLPPPPADAEQLTYARDLRSVRMLVARHAERAGLDADRTADLVLAAGEVCANTLRHTTGLGTVWVWHRRAEVICQVNDQGWITDPLAGRRRPPEASGLGLWVVHQVCDLVQMRTGRRGTTIRMHMGLV
ncbi:MAG TPA: sensor histidine kinase [Streptosporangiaceae bacterium]|jgi:anti-sigma regulatory factor (Ser/Thr protein kinase)